MNEQQTPIEQISPSIDPLITELTEIDANELAQPNPDELLNIQQIPIEINPPSLSAQRVFEHEDDLLADHMIITFGPQHPTAQGVMRFVTHTDGEYVAKVVPQFGLLHRGVEKLAENRTWRQLPVLAGRIDFLAAIYMESLCAMAVEQIARIPVSPKAKWLRIILQELSRIHSHLFWFGMYGHELGNQTVLFYAMRERESVCELFESLTGKRMIPNFIRIGGVRKDVEKVWLDAAIKFCKQLPDRIDEFRQLLLTNPIHRLRSEKIGVLQPHLALSYGITGPNLRSCGIAHDLRLYDPFYKEIGFRTITSKVGDTFERVLVRLRELEISAEMIINSISALPEGEVLTSVPKDLIVPKGEAYVALEGPRGEYGLYIQSERDRKPYRFHLRSPSLAAASAIDELVRGHYVADMIAIICSLDLLASDIDR